MRRLNKASTINQGTHTPLSYRRSYRLPTASSRDRQETYVIYTCLQVSSPSCIETQTREKSFWQNSEPTLATYRMRISCGPTTPQNPNSRVNFFFQIFRKTADTCVRARGVLTGVTIMTTIMVGSVRDILDLSASFFSPAVPQRMYVCMYEKYISYIPHECAPSLYEQEK